MKWFKHESDAHKNLKLQSVIDRYGLEGFGYYWACAELCAKEGKECRVEATKEWKIHFSKFLNIEIKKQDSFLKFFAEKNLIDKDAFEKGDLFMPKLEERSDDYTNKVRRVSGQYPNIVPLEEKRIEEKRREEITLPDWINKKAWESWVSYRKEIKKLLKPSTIRLQLKMLEENKQDHSQIIKNSISNGWTGLFPLKEKDRMSGYNRRAMEAEERASNKESLENNEALRKLEGQKKILLANFTQA